MLYKYCPNCASLRITPVNGGVEHKCCLCDYQGEMKEDTIDKINDFKKILDAKTNEDNYSTYPLRDMTEKPNIKDKIKKISKQSGDWELL
jgi:hypothetical protein